MKDKFIITIENKKLKIPTELRITNLYWSVYRRRATKEENKKMNVKYVSSLEQVCILNIIPYEISMKYYQKIKGFLYEVEFNNGHKKVVGGEELFDSPEKFTQLTGLPT